MMIIRGNGTNYDATTNNSSRSECHGMKKINTYDYFTILDFIANL